MPLTPERIKDIEAKAQDVLAGYFPDGKMKVPIPVEDIARKYGLQVQYAEFPDKSVSGVFKRSNNSGEIYVAAQEPRFRQNFTIGHELGHFILHPNHQEVLYRRDTLNLTEEERDTEAEANWFAAALLIPEAELKKYWKATHDTQLLSTYFSVSPVALRLRLKDLGLET